MMMCYFLLCYRSQIKLKMIYLIALFPLMWMGALSGNDAGAPVDKTTNYKRQIIAVIGDDSQLNFAAHYLYKKHPEVSDVVKWSAGDAKFKLAQWNDDTKKYEFYPKGQEKDIPPLPEERSRVQVVGHGKLENDEATLGGLLPNELAQGLKKLPGVEKAGEITRVSLVGCNVGKLKDSGQEFVGNEYPKTLLETLKGDGIATEVSSRVGIVGVDSTGRKVVGKLLPDGNVAWRVGEGNIKKTVVKYEGADVDIITTPITRGDTFTKPESLSSKTKAERDSLLSKVSQLDHFSVKITDGSGASNEDFYFDSDTLFDIMSDVSKRVFDDIKVPQDWPNDISSDRIVRPVDGSDPVKIKVREPRNVKDIMTDIKYFGERGFEYPRNVNGKKVTKDEHGNAFEDKFVYYRFGDWVVNMKYQASKAGMKMDPFYAHMEGIIHAEDPTKPTDTKNENVKFPKVGKVDYPTLLPKTGENFFSDSQAWMTGNNDQIKVSDESAYNAIASVALLIPESIRDYRSWSLSKMAIDLYNHGGMSSNKYYDGHAMARGGVAPAKYTGNRDVLWEAEGKKGIEKNWNEYPQGVFLKKRFARMAGEWLTALDTKTDDGLELKGKNLKRKLDSTDKDSGPKEKRQKITEKVTEQIAKVAKMEPDQGSEYLNIPPDNEVFGPLGDGPWDARPVAVPELETAQSEVDNYEEGEDRSMSGRASDALNRDQAYISKQINKKLEEQELKTGKRYEVDKSSVKIENGRIKFTSYDSEDPSNREDLEEILDESKISSKEILNEMKGKGKKTGGASRVGRVQSIYGTILGIQGTIEMFKKGDIVNGAISLLQTAHGLGELTGFTKKVSEAASRGLGNYMNDDVAEVSEMGEDLVEGEGASMLAGDAEELGALGTEAADAAEDIPIIGTVFGVYNIYEDLKQHTVMGYVDAGLDALTTFAGLFGPEAEPVVVILTAIRMTIDTFYNDIKKELDALPLLASVGDILVAVFKGIGKALLDIADFLTGNIFSAPSKVHELNKQYDKDQELLKSLSDYHNYYTVAAGPDSSTINFAKGEVSWDGGDIVFVLHDDHTAQLTMTMTDMDGKEVRHEETLQFGEDVKDVVMGIGESHSVHFTEKEVKVLWFIPVDKKSIIDGIQGDRSTIHGSYTGNKEDNNFYAVQELPPDAKLDYTLKDYYYVIKGGEGDDSFYLGPQHNQVEGNEGSDSYFIKFSHTVINNYAVDGVDDYLNVDRSYFSLYFHRMDYDLNVSSIDANNPLSVIIKNWFKSEAYQHMHFRSSDGIFFSVSPQKNGTILTIPYALGPPSNNHYSHWDASALNFSKVEYLYGSPRRDYLVGNDIDNTIVSGGNDDNFIEEIFSGGKGANTFDLTGQKETEPGSVWIRQYASDQNTDTIYLPVDSNQFSLQQHYDDLNIVYFGKTMITLLSWWDFQYSRPIQLVTKDSDVFGLYPSNTFNVSLTPVLLTFHSATRNVLHRNATYKDLSQLSVVGSPYDDYIVGINGQDYIKPGGGKDYISGGEGQDVYIMQQGDGSVVIGNFAYDQQQDLLLFGTEYSDVSLINYKSVAVNISSHKYGENMQVCLLNWLVGENDQHLLVQTNDGISFAINATKSNSYPRPSPEKIPVAIDKSGSEEGIYFDLNTKEWRNVERVIGSPFQDNVWGSELDNYFDLREGGGYVAGRNGSDTYVYNQGYGILNVDNLAGDNVTDSLVIMMPFDEIKVSKGDNKQDLVLNMTNSTGPLDIVFLNKFLMLNKTRHLQVTSSDGFIFVLPASNDFQPVIVGLNKVRDKSGQFVNLTSSLYNRVIVDYGANNFTNHINGNDMNNTLVGGIEDDYIYGGPGNDVLKGKAGNNTLHGGDGDDVLIGGVDTDMMDGGPGDDVLFPGFGDNQVLGGPGDDTVCYMGDPISEDGITVDLGNGDVLHTLGVDYIDDIENVYGTPYNDTIITAGFLDNVALGMNGNDTLIALGGYDNLSGGEGNDTYDLTNAQGTKVINNTAEDGIIDTLIFPYDARLIRFETQGHDLIFRVVSTRFYPNNNTEPFNACNGQDPPQEVDLYPPVNNANCSNRRRRNIITEEQESLSGSPLNTPELEGVEKEKMAIGQLNSIETREFPFKYSTTMKRRTSGLNTSPPFTRPPTTGSTPTSTWPPPTWPPTTGSNPTSPPTTSAPPTNPPPSDNESFIELCEVYNPDLPTVVLKNWFLGAKSQHIQIQTAECLIGMDYLAKMPIIVNCIQEVC